MTVLLDTGPLVALCDARDAKHRTAVRHLEVLAGDAFVVCDAVLTETCLHLRHRAQRLRLRTLLGELSVGPMPAAQAPDVWWNVFDWLAKYADHQPDWADACLAVLSGRDKDLKVWTYDREFRTTWRRPDGTPIPMAVRVT